MYKGEKRTGIYNRMIISLNRFSKEVPVLCDRKKWRFDPLKHKTICNPFIDIDGNVLMRKLNKWTEEMKISLYSITEKIKKLMVGKQIPWIRYEEFDVKFKGFTPKSLNSMYYKALVTQKLKYDKLSTDVHINLITLIELKWMDNYKNFKELEVNNEVI